MLRLRMYSLNYRAGRLCATRLQGTVPREAPRPAPQGSPSSRMRASIAASFSEIAPSCFANSLVCLSACPKRASKALLWLTTSRAFNSYRSAALQQQASAFAKRSSPPLVSFTAPLR